MDENTIIEYMSYFEDTSLNTPKYDTMMHLWTMFFAKWGKSQKCKDLYDFGVSGDTSLNARRHISKRLKDIFEFYDVKDITKYGKSLSQK